MSKVKEEEFKADLQHLLDVYASLILYRTDTPIDIMRGALTEFQEKNEYFIEKWGIIDDRREP